MDLPHNNNGTSPEAFHNKDLIVSKNQTRIDTLHATIKTKQKTIESYPNDRFNTY